MARPRRFRLALFLFSICSILSAPVSQKTWQETESTELLKNLNPPGWARTEKIERFEKNGLFGYIDGGAEIFLQYGFEELSVARYKSLSPQRRRSELVLEIYRMGSPEDAFGIFSSKRDGGEKTSGLIMALNWISPSQVNFAKSRYFVNILGFDCGEKALEEFAVLAAHKISGVRTDIPPLVSALPQEGLRPGSERYIKGELAASAEAPFFTEHFWGFSDGWARAVSGKYLPLNSKLIIVDTGMARPDLTEKVEVQFREYLKEVRLSKDTVTGKNEAGYHFVFRQNGRWAAIILAEPDVAAAEKRLKEALTNVSSIRHDI
jgi:hypothetical protein